MATRAATPNILTVNVTPDDDGVTVQLGGVFDALGVPAFSAVVSPLLYERRQPPIDIDVGALTHLTGSGLGAIVFAVQFAEGHGQSCRVTGASGQPAAMLQTVALMRGAPRVLGAIN
jgi:anti-anti-sigma regulatory factor